MISNPFLINKILKSTNIFSYDPNNPTPTPTPPLVQLFQNELFPLNLENNKTGLYSTDGQITEIKRVYDEEDGVYIPEEVKIKITSVGALKNSSNVTISTKKIVCKIIVDLVDFYGIGLKNAIATDQNLTAGKVNIYLDSGVNIPANVYSNANITNIAGTIPGSVYAKGGEIFVDNNTIVKGDVIAYGQVQLNNSVQVKGKVVSATSYVNVNNKATVAGDTVGYGIDNKGNSVNLVNSTVNKVYTKNGESCFYEKNSTYIGPIYSLPVEPNYPAEYSIPSEELPVINDSIREIWINQAQSGDTINGDYHLSNGIEGSLSNNTFINGNLILDNNATLNIKNDSVIFVTGNIFVENNAKINGAGSLITDDYFNIQNNSIPTSISIVALGTGTSYLTNNSATTGAIMVPNGYLDLSNNAIVHGGIFAKSIPCIGNNTVIYFNPSNIQNLPPTKNTTDVLTLESWLEDI